MSKTPSTPFFIKKIILVLEEKLLNALRLLNNEDKFLAIVVLLKIQYDIKDLVDEFTFKNNLPAIEAWLARVKHQL